MGLEELVIMAINMVQLAQYAQIWVHAYMKRHNTETMICKSRKIWLPCGMYIMSNTSVCMFCLCLTWIIDAKILQLEQYN